jgi:hypothetical protein
VPTFLSRHFQRVEMSIQRQEAAVIVKAVPTGRALTSMGVREGEHFEPFDLVQVDKAVGRLTVFPKSTGLSREHFGRQKYRQIREISIPLPNWAELPTDSAEVEQLLELLPTGFTKDPDFGLGLPGSYRQLIDAIEEQTDCNELYIFNTSELSHIDGKVFRLSIDDFDDIRAKMDLVSGRASTAASRVKKADAHNWMAGYTGSERVEYITARHPMIQAFTDAAASNVPMNEATIAELVEVLELGSESLARTRPDLLTKLRTDVDLVELDALIHRFQKMLTESCSEATWQKFFATNPFILTFGLGHPLVMVQSQASVGGMKISGQGVKIADFLTANIATQSVALFEIKKPATQLLRSEEYRGGVYAPSLELAGSIVQALDQRYNFQMSFPQLLAASETRAFESYGVRLCLIIGTTPASRDEKKSFELFRASMREVDIFTFDELLARVKLLRTFIETSP